MRLEAKGAAPDFGPFPKRRGREMGTTILAMFEGVPLAEHSWERASPSSQAAVLQVRDLAVEGCGIPPDTPIGGKD